MRRANVYVQDRQAGVLEETDNGKYVFTYSADYTGSPVSLTLPPREKPYTFEAFPTFFEGLLPEGDLLEALLRREKVDKNDYLTQLLTVGADLVGDVTVRKTK